MALLPSLEDARHQDWLKDVLSFRLPPSTRENNDWIVPCVACAAFIAGMLFVHYMRLP